TLDALEAIGPDIVVAGHCTGWKAIHRIAARLLEAFVPSNVGTRLCFGSSGLEDR
ncbi:MAG: MBL fold metallo-hydrolase, partial [Chloroflexi bacterium]|nr:MBL fold metallo-hydrolase [Chloroflexota bacterium]